MGKITKAVIPAAGLGTRFLPATKALPKEMLPIIDKPVIQFVVEEAVSSGTPHILMITGRNKNALENHFDRAVELENLLDEKGDQNKLTSVNESTDLADIHYVRQGDPLGLGHAVLKAKFFVGNEPFALLLGDEIIDDGGKLLREMLDTSERYSVNVIAVMEVPDEEVKKYGIAVLGNETISGAHEVLSLVEKPDPEEVSSRWAVLGRYVMMPEIFRILEEVLPGVGGEIQLTDALNRVAHSDKEPGLFAIKFEGNRFDTGDKYSYLQTIVQMAINREDIGEKFKYWLRDIISKN